MIKIFSGYDIYAILDNPLFLLLSSITIFAISYSFFKKQILLNLFKGFLAVAIAIFVNSLIDMILRYSRSIESYIIIFLISSITMFLYFYLIGCDEKISALLGLFSSFAWFGIGLVYSLIFLRIIPEVYEMLLGVKPFDLDLNYQGIIFGISITGIVCAVTIRKYCSKNK